MLSISAVQALKQQLQDQRRSLLSRLQAHESSPLKSMARANSKHADRARDQMMRDQEAAMLAQSKQQLNQIETALRRIEDGLYGKCMTCGGSISLSRLQALPSAMLCIRCQSEQDQRGAQP
ncbi:MAG: TraR/DksA family transcriptional regulator [Anaerolineales bacterium]